MIGSFFSNTLQSKPKLIEFFLESLSASASAPSLPSLKEVGDLLVVQLERISLHEFLAEREYTRW